MKEKLRLLLDNEGLKPGQFAEMLGINPAGVSHILAGRNKPGFELLQKILRRFPRINPDWLIIDRGPMYRDQAHEDEAIAPTLDGEEPRTDSEPTMLNRPTLFDPAEPMPPLQTEPLGAPPQLEATAQNSKRKVARVVIFYADQTFESFTPSNHN